MIPRTVRAGWLTLVLACAPASANPLDAFGFGPRGIALGGAMTALADDFSANYYNPAGLALAGDMRLDLGYTVADPALTLNGRDQGVDDSRGFQGGVTLPGVAFDRRFGLSIGLHLPDERISRIRALPERQPRWVLYDNRPQRLVLTSSAGFEVLPGLFVGAGLTYLAGTSGVLDVGGQVSVTDVERTQLLSGVDVDLAAVRYLSAGVLFAPDDSPWRAGLSYREAFSLSLDLDVKVAGAIAIGPMDNILVEEGLFLFNSSSDTLYSPQQLTLGGAYAGRHWTVSADLQWVDWSAFPTPSARVAVDLDLGPLAAEIPLPAEPSDPAFKDTFVPRIGVEYLTLETQTMRLRARLGYFFEPSPAPKQPGATNFVDSGRHAASAGLGLELRDWTAIFPKPITIDVAGQWIALSERDYHKTDPADPTGDYRADGRILTVSALLGVRL